MFIKEKLALLIGQAIDELKANDVIDVLQIPEIAIERPQNIQHGDYSSSIALKLSRAAKIAPLDIARKIVEHIKPSEEIEHISVLPPGFINFKLKGDWLCAQVQTIIYKGSKWGDIDIGKGKSVQVEYVSVNPTGPLHIGHGRGAVLGSTLANILSAAGYKVQTEYYINDAGSQLNAFKQSLNARFLQHKGIDTAMPENGYMGNYMIQLARKIDEKYPGRFDGSNVIEKADELGAIGVDLIMDKIREDLELLGVSFDLWFSEKSLNEENVYNKVLKFLEDHNYTLKKENALWFTSSSLGEDKDNVLIRGDGTPTYFAYDIAYHYNKFIQRKFSHVIDIWGADHQGHVSRMKSAISAFGVNPDNLTIIICQMVTLKRGEEIVRASKRSGDLITLRDLLDEVGADACRYVFLSRSADSQMDFDIELAKKQSADNPVYYVQYAHARISSILKLAQANNIDYSEGDVHLLIDDAEQLLIRQMLLLPEIVEYAASNLEPHQLPYYAAELATAFHSFYKKCRVISDNAELTKARLKLVKAAQILLSRTLHLMGMTAPESM
ncbi:MAG TPA: arginine--tRNA ligase [Dehalococcoidia bacterium]|nr:arginine--tRNA ligase [Dehalococcoidia bacterium]